MVISKEVSKMYKFSTLWFKFFLVRFMRIVFVGIVFAGIVFVGTVSVTLIFYHI